MKIEERVRKPFVAFEVDALQFLVKKGKKRVRKSKSKKSVSPAAKLARQVSEAAEVSLSRQQSAKAEKLFRAGCLSHKWQYKNDSGKWADYDKNASAEVERAYASWLVNPHIDVRSVHSGDWDYMVDFNLMTQQNIRHQAHKIRSIQRVVA